VPSILKREDLKDGPRWIVQWTDARGERRQKTTRVRTRREAERIAHELESKAERQRAGLEPMHGEDGGGRLADLLGRWHRLKAHKPAAERNLYQLEKHLLHAPLGKLRLSELRASDVENFLDEKEAEGLSAQTINHLRGYISRALNTARRKGWWTGVNVVQDVKPRPVPTSVVGDYLRPDEVPAVLTALAQRWRPLFATAIYTGLRKSELRALRKTDVDLDRQLISVRRSGDRETTKGGHADVIPIHPELAPFLEHALATSPGPFVFPHVCAPGCRAEGVECPGPTGMMAPDVALESVLRRAMGRAGLVLGYTHVCRKRGCTHREEAADAELRRCPVHGDSLWPKPNVRPIRFHDLRHTTASLLLHSRVPMAVVQKVLRHRDPRLTSKVYGHLAPEYLHAEVARMRLLGGDLQGQLVPNSEQTVAKKAADKLQIFRGALTQTVIGPNSSATAGASEARSTGLEPVTSGVTGRRSNQLN